MGDTIWNSRTGRDGDGERFAVAYLTHGSGRVLAKVFGPAGNDEFLYRASFYCAVPPEVLDTSETFDFVDLDSAMAFVDGILAQFDPLAKPRPKVQQPMVDAVRVPSVE